MSGVYIPGMKKPYDCPACPAAHWNAASCFTGCEIVPGKRYAMADPDYAFSSEPPDWCPLVPVPDHGRLGDLDKLVAAYDAEHVGPPGRARELMLEAPAVIPADKEAET